MRISWAFTNTSSVSIPPHSTAMTAVMLESARKGYWKASDEQLKTTASLHAQITREKGAACTEFVCDNTSLQSLVANRLNDSERADLYPKHAGGTRSIP